MTWHHVAALMLAVVLIVAVLYSPGCKDAMPAVSMLASGLIAGVFGHARNQIVHADGKSKGEGSSPEMLSVRRD